MSIAHAVEVFSKYGDAFRIRHSSQHHDFLETKLGTAEKGLLDARPYRDQRKLGSYAKPCPAGIILFRRFERPEGKPR